MKKSSDTIGNRTHDPPLCSAVPQPTALPVVTLVVPENMDLDQNLHSKRVVDIAILLVQLAVTVIPNDLNVFLVLNNFVSKCNITYFYD